METFAEHIYTLPLLGACRLAAASFRMDPCASSSSSSLSKISPNAASETNVKHAEAEAEAAGTNLVYLDWFVSLLSLAVYITLLSTIGPTESHWVLEAAEGHVWLQWLLFLLLAFTHLAQVSKDCISTIVCRYQQKINNCVQISTKKATTACTCSKYFH